MKKVKIEIEIAGEVEGELKELMKIEMDNRRKENNGGEGEENNGGEW
jgi:hypothetical protein